MHESLGQWKLCEQMHCRATDSNLHCPNVRIVRLPFTAKAIMNVKYLYKTQ